MKEIAGKKYYNKKEICEQLGIAEATLNKRIRQTRVDGFFIGRSKHYDDDQIKQLIEYNSDTFKK